MVGSTIDSRLDRWPALPLEARCALIRDLLELFWGPLSDEHGIPAAELADLDLPVALRALYTSFGRRLDRLRRQNRLAEPEELATSRVLFVENQGNFEVAIELTDHPDPLVVWSPLPDGLERPDAGGARVSDLLLQVVLSEWVTSAPAVASTCLGRQRSREVIRTVLAQLPIAPWPWPEDGTVFVYGHGLYGFIHPVLRDDGEWIHVGGLRADSFEVLRDTFDVDRWDYRPDAVVTRGG